MTYNFLESVTLKDTSDSLVYRLHINMDAVSVSDVGEPYPEGWGDLPHQIYDAYEKELANEKVDKQALQDVIDSIDTLDESDYTPESWAALQTELDNAIAIINDKDATQEEVDAKVIDLNNVISDLVLVGPELNYEIGEKLELFEHDWTVLAKEEGKYLIIVDQLEPEDYMKMNLSTYPTMQVDAKTRFTNSNEYISYEESLIREVDEAFYSTFIQGKASESKVEKVEWNEESILPQANWNKRTDGKAYVSPISGTKTAFTLSISDILFYDLEKTLIAEDTVSWLRSPGYNPQYGSIIRAGGRLVQAKIDTEYVVRPAIWVDLSK